jgi:hypothetical protein
VDFNPDRVGGFTTECKSTIRNAFTVPGNIATNLGVQLNPPFRPCDTTNGAFKTAVYTIHGSTSLRDIVSKDGGKAHLNIQIQSDLSTGFLSGNIIVNNNNNDAVQIHSVEITTQCFATPFFDEPTDFS